MKMTISDPENRWPPAVVNFKPDKVPDSVTWDRRFADGTLAPSGEYRVVVRACDVRDLCGSAWGIIAIPFVSTSTVTLTPSPTTTLTATSQATSTVTPRPVSILPTPQAIPPQTNRRLRYHFGNCWDCWVCFSLSPRPV